MDIRLLEALGAIAAFTGLLWWYFFGPRVGHGKGRGSRHPRSTCGDPQEHFAQCLAFLCAPLSRLWPWRQVLSQWS